MSQAIEKRREMGVARTTDLVSAGDVAAVTNRIALIQQCMKQLMQENTHFGKIPGVAKMSLLKPGAELLNTAFQFAVTYPAERISRVLEKDFVCYEVTCTLVHIPSGRIVGEGVGLCSSREDKYAYRRGSIACPVCGKETIIKGKAEY